MRIKIADINIPPGRRKMDPDHVKELANSIRETTLINPITINRNNTLIAGLHRLEAVKSLGWEEIECTVSNMDELRDNLVEIDENLVRKELDPFLEGEMLLRKKQIYEDLHPSSKQGGDRKSEKSKRQNCHFDYDKPFVEETAEKQGVSSRTISREIQAAKNLDDDAKRIIRNSEVKMSKSDVESLSRLNPEQQRKVAKQLVKGEIKKVREYGEKTGKEIAAGQHDETTEEKIGDIDGGMITHETNCLNDKVNIPIQDKTKQFSSFKESVADLKNPNKDCSCTPDSFLAELTAFVHQFQKGIKWYDQPYYSVIFPLLTQGQLDYLREQMDLICSEAEKLYNIVERINDNELQKEA